MVATGTVALPLLNCMALRVDRRRPLHHAALANKQSRVDVQKRPARSVNRRGYGFDDKLAPQI